VSPEEAKEIDQWLATSNLNQYGDAPNTVYMGMSVRRGSKSNSQQEEIRLSTWRQERSAIDTSI